LVLWRMVRKHYREKACDGWGGGAGGEREGIGRMGKGGRMSLGWNYKGNKRDGNYTPSNGDTNITFPPIRTVNSGAQIHCSDKHVFF
jgi:hypothetical protein